jgi:hypothetical protein
MVTATIARRRVRARFGERNDAIFRGLAARRATSPVVDSRRMVYSFNQKDLFRVGEYREKAAGTDTEFVLVRAR